MATDELKTCRVALKRQIDDIISYARQVKDLDDKLTGGAGQIQEDSVVSLLLEAEAALHRVELKRVQVEKLLTRLKVACGYDQYVQERQRSLEDRAREQADQVREVKKAVWQGTSDEHDHDREDLYVSCKGLLDKLHNPETGLKDQVKQVADQLNTGERRLTMVQEKLKRNAEEMRGLVSSLRKLRELTRARGTTSEPL